MRRVVFRAGGVHGHRVAPDERDALTDKVLRGRPAETGPIFQKAPPIPTRPPSPVPPVADEDTVPGLQGTILRFPGPNAVRAEQVAGPEIRGLYSGGAAREEVQGDAVRAVAGWAFGDEVEGGVDVGAGVLAQGQAVVGRDVAEVLGLVEGATEAGVGRPGGNVLLQGVGEVHPVVAVEGVTHPAPGPGWRSPGSWR